MPTRDNNVSHAVVYFALLGRQLVAFVYSNGSAWICLITVAVCTVRFEQRCSARVNCSLRVMLVEDAVHNVEVVGYWQYPSTGQSICAIAPTTVKVFIAL